MFLNLLAHAGEIHDTTEQSLTHRLEQWYVAVIVFAVLLFVVGNLVYLLTKKSLNRTLTILSTMLFVSAYLVYQNLKVLSVLCLVTSFIFVIVLIMNPKSQSANKNTPQK